MNLNELQRSSIFSSKEKEQTGCTAKSSIVNMRFYAKELISNFKYFQELDASGRLAVITFDAIRANVNDYLYSFVDAVSALCYNPANSIKSLVRSFTSEYGLNTELKAWVEFLVRRNDLIHDCFGRVFLNEELYNALLNYEDCVIELVDFIESELKSKNLLDVKVHKR